MYDQQKKIIKIKISMPLKLLKIQNKNKNIRTFFLVLTKLMR